MDKVIDKTKEFHFTIVDNYILNSASLSAFEQIVYIHLKQYSAQTNKCFPGINKLAAGIDVSTNTIRKILKGLKEKGFISIQPRFNDSNEYTLLAYPEYALEINKNYKDEELDKGISKVLRFYQNNINPTFGSMERERLITWFDAFDNNEELLIKAIEMAVEQGVRKIKYIESILINWQDSGIKTVEQCEAYLKEWEEKRRRAKNGGTYTNSETVAEDRYDFSKFSNL